MYKEQFFCNTKIKWHYNLRSTPMTNFQVIFIFHCVSLCVNICHATGMEEDPEVTLDIHCLQQGGGAALTSTNNYFLHRRGSGGARAITV